MLELPFKALSDPIRRDIVAWLSESPLAVHEIARRLPVSRPAVSKHLRILEDAGLIGHRKVGKQNVYSLQAAPLVEMSLWLQAMWTRTLHSLKQTAEGQQ